MKKIKYSKKVLVVYMAIITLAFILSLGAHAQNVMRRGNTFIQVDSVTKSEPHQTEYTYIDNKGVEYPIWVSSKGKFFIKRISKRTGKEYRQYLPSVEEKLKPKSNGQSTRN